MHIESNPITSIVLMGKSNKEKKPTSAGMVPLIFLLIGLLKLNIEETLAPSQFLLAT